METHGRDNEGGRAAPACAERLRGDLQQARVPRHVDERDRRRGRPVQAHALSLLPQQGRDPRQALRERHGPHRQQRPGDRRGRAQPDRRAARADHLPGPLHVREPGPAQAVLRRGGRTAGRAAAHRPPAPLRLREHPQNGGRTAPGRYRHHPPHHPHRLRQHLPRRGQLGLQVVRPARRRGPANPRRAHRRPRPAPPAPPRPAPGHRPSHVTTIRLRGPSARHQALPARTGDRERRSPSGRSAPASLAGTWVLLVVPLHIAI